MIGLKFFTGQGNIIEVISEPYVIQMGTNLEVRVFVRNLKTDSTYEELLYSLKRIATKEEVINKGR